MLVSPKRKKIKEILCGGLILCTLRVLSILFTILLIILFMMPLYITNHHVALTYWKFHFIFVTS